ncbi:MAG TPA: FAD-binding domain [Xanthomonadaceae bacterium]|nr:FAD-binding domain [Xanthomonadaceae bacterium]
MENRKILIVGSGIAGPTLAWWLRRHGFEPTVVERAPSLRTGGYIVDFWGTGYDVAEQMGLLPTLSKLSLPIEEVRLVDDDGQRKGGLGGKAIRSMMRGRFLSILRSDLAATIHASLGDDVRTLFGETIVRIDQSEHGVWVEFRDRPSERFDVVIGAGGLHSPVRGLVFGAERSFEKFLGYYAASFSADDYPHRDPHAYVSYSVPGRQITRYSLVDGRTVFLLVFSAQSKLDVSPRDVRTQKDLLRREFGGKGWECNDILSRLDANPDLYFDAVSQIRMNAWSHRRTALVGDACGCPSLLAGEGSALAMAGAYTLAGKMKRSGGDHRIAFANYERLFRPLIASKQRSAERFAKSFVPGSRAGIFVRNQLTRLMNLPYVAQLTMGRMLKDPIELPVY